MNGYEFSSANLKELSEIMDIYHSLVGTPGCTWNLGYPDEATAKSDIGRQLLYVLKKDGFIVAVASLGEFDELKYLDWLPENPCELSRVGVRPMLQKQGIGTIVLQNIIKTAREKGFDGLVMLVSKINSSALALYDRNGFERCGETFMYDIDFYCYQMKFDEDMQ